MANFQANLRTLVTRGYDLPQFIDILNTKVCEITKGEKFITLFLALYNFKTRVLTYVNAGHNPSLLYNAGQIELLDQGCTILGMFENLPLVQYGEVAVKPGSTIVNYTDGLSEAADASGNLFEIEGLTAFLKENHEMDLGAFNTKLIERVVAFKQGTEFDDDITLLTLRFK
jgi:sigma-B regulation protein RsbU (phosphoserine phosphatase)